MKQKDIKKFWIIAACLLAAEAVGLCVAMNWQRLFASHEVSELYTRYAGREGFEVSFVEGLRIDDSTRVPVTLIKATDSTAWATLKNDLGINEPTEEILEAVKKGRDISTLRTKDTYPDGSICLLATSHLNKAVCVFRPNNEDELTAIIQYKLFNKDTQQ